MKPSIQSRFVASNASHLVELARIADPPVADGDRASVTCGARTVTLEAKRVDLYVEWTEVDDGERSR